MFVIRANQTQIKIVNLYLILLATITFFTRIPSLGVCFVINLLPTILLTSCSTSSGLWNNKELRLLLQLSDIGFHHLFVMWTPPLKPFSKWPFPRPPAKICALTTYSGTSVSNEMFSFVLVEFQKLYNSKCWRKKPLELTEFFQVENVILLCAIENSKFLNSNATLLQQWFALVLKKVKVSFVIGYHLQGFFCRKPIGLVNCMDVAFYKLTFLTRLLGCKNLLAKNADMFVRAFIEIQMPPN